MLGFKQILVVAIGGACGSVVRYKLSGLVMHQTPTWQFPLGTFLVNVLGCFAIGILGALAEHHDLFLRARGSCCLPGCSVVSQRSRLLVMRPCSCCDAV